MKLSFRTLIMKDVKNGIKYFFSRFHFDKTNDDVLFTPTILFHTERHDRALVINWIKWSFVIYFGNIGRN